MDISDLIASRPTERRQLADWYSDLIDAAQREGLSVAEVATRAGVVKETIYAWRRRRNGPRAKERTHSSTPGLVRVRVATGRPSDHEREQSIAVRLANGRQILVPSGFNPDALVATLERC